MQKSNHIIPILLILLFIYALSSAAWFSFDIGLDMTKNEIQGEVITEAKTIDAFALIDNKQQPFTLQNLKDKWSMLLFGYSHCADECSTTLSTLKQVDALLSSHQAEPTQVVFVSVDHERDKPETLDEYLSNFGNDFVGVTGSAEALEKFADNLGMTFKKTAMSNANTDIDDYQIDHATSIMLVNPDAKVKAVLSAPHRVGDLYNDIMTIIEN
jgi:protein SCO1/2